MAKRLSDTEIWKKQRWFRKLIPEYKLAFCYIKDQCNHAGIWNIDCSDLIEDLGIKEFDILKFADMCNTEYDKITGEKIVKERIRPLHKGYVWVTGFIQFQYSGKDGYVNIHSAPVKTALQALSGLNLLKEGIDKGYVTLTDGVDKGYVSAKDKDIYSLVLDSFKPDKSKIKKNGKSGNNFSGNFKSQGEDVLISRHFKNLEEKDRARGNDNQSKG